MASNLDRITTSISRSITRRSMLKRSAGLAAGAGVALATPLMYLDQRTAEAAASCSVWGTSSIWGTSCATTPSCNSQGAPCTSEGGCSINNARKRCSHWPTAEANGNYCWCSQKICLQPTGIYRWYLCCDCWVGAYNNGCHCKFANCAGGGGDQVKCVCKTEIKWGQC
ncbi:MAG: hypothetical protein GY788_29520 [bacterium]|nr:hypothetical protein [bacterium]